MSGWHERKPLIEESTEETERHHEGPIKVNGTWPYK